MISKLTPAEREIAIDNLLHELEGDILSLPEMLDVATGLMCRLYQRAILEAEEAERNGPVTIPTGALVIEINGRRYPVTVVYDIELGHGGGGRRLSVNLDGMMCQWHLDADQPDQAGLDGLRSMIERVIGDKR